jgi:hypothetical protein
MNSDFKKRNNKINFTAGNIGFCASWAEGITMNICATIWQQFGLDKQHSTLVLIINFY